MRRAGARPRRPLEFTVPPTKFPRTKAFPRGEGVSAKPGRMRNSETFRIECTKIKRTHERNPPNSALPLGELVKISDFRLRGQQR